MKNSLKNNTLNIKNAGGLALILVPILLTYVIEIIAYFADFALVFVLNNYLGLDIDYDNTEAFSGIAPINTNLMLFLYAMLCMIIFGWWYMLINGSTFPEGNTDSGKNGIRSFFTKKLPLMILFGYSFQLLIGGILKLLRKLFPSLLEEHDNTISSLTDKGSFFLIITVVILTPVAEELIFRAVTLHFCSKYMSDMAAIIVSAVLFGLYHSNPVQMAYAFIAGMILGFLAVKTGSIAAPILMHIIINASAYLVPSVLFDSPVTTVLTIIASCAVIYLVYFIVHKNHQDTDNKENEEKQSGKLKDDKKPEEKQSGKRSENNTQKNKAPRN